MSENDRETHRILVAQTGVHKFNREQLEVMDKIMGETTLDLAADLADAEATLDLPILARRKGK